MIDSLRMDPHELLDRTVRIMLGTADLDALREKDLQHLLEAADSALYRAKSEGRNRIRCHGGYRPR